MDFQRIESPAEDWHQIELPLNESSEELISKEENILWQMASKGVRFNDATRFGYLNFKITFNG